MPSPAVSDAAVRASLFFAVGKNLPASGNQPGNDRLSSQKKSASADKSLDPDIAQAVTHMLAEQGTGELTHSVLETIQAGKRAVSGNSQVSISAQRYDQVRKEFLSAHGITAGKGKSVWPVGSRTILKQSGGSWSQALREAGLAASSRNTSSAFGAARFTPDQFTAALQDFATASAESGNSTSYQNYVSWRKAQQDQGRADLPSGPSIRNTYGSWNAALEAETPD